MPSKAFKLAEAMVSNPVMSDMVENPTATPTQIAAVETKTSAISDTGVISVNTKNIVSNNVLTQSFDSNQVVGFNLTDSINAVSPIVSVFKEVPVTGVISKGQWDVNANATNYEFFDEKPISYSSSTLTPSAAGNGTFTNSSAIVTPYILSNLSYDSKSFDASTQLGNAEGIAFKSDGTAMYLIGFSNDKVWQYTLSTAYDISTASYSNKSFSVASQDGVPRDVRFKPDGTIMYVIASTAPDSVYQYTLSTAWDISTASYANKSLSVQSQSVNPAGLVLSPDGAKVYVAGHSNRIVFQYNLSTAWDVSTGTYSNNSINLSSGVFTASNPSLNALEVNADASKLFVATHYEIAEYNMPSDGDISNASYVAIHDVTDTTVGNKNIGGMTFANNGAKFYIFGNNDMHAYQFSSTASLAFNSSDVGKKVVGNSGSAIITSTAGTYTSVTPFADTSTISSWQLFGAQGKADGSGVTLSGYGNTYDLSNVSYDNKKYVATQLSDPEGIVFKSDGTAMYITGYSNNTVYQYTLSTAWDVSTASYANKSLSVASQNTVARDIRFKPDGTIMYIVGASSPDSVYQYNLSTAWDVSTASYANKSINVSSQDTNPAGLALSPDGTKVYICGYHSKTIFQYNLSTAWDLSTSSYSNNSLSLVNDFNYSLNSILINPTGTKIYISNDAGYTSNNMVAEYNLPSDGDISNLTHVTNHDFTGLVFTQNVLVGSTKLTGISFSGAGDKFYSVGNVVTNSIGGREATVHQFSAGSSVYAYSQYMPALTNSSNGQINSSSWQDINSMTADETKNDGDIFYAVSTDNRTSWSVAKGSDGVRKIAKNNSGTWQYNNNTGSSTAVGFSLASPSYDNKSYSVSHSNPRGMYLKPDGTELYIGAYTGHVYQFTLSTPNDISTASSTGNYNIDEENDTVALTFKPDGTKMYAASGTNVHQYTLSTAWDITTASYDSVSYTPSDMGSSDIHSLNFNSDGTKLFMSDDGSSDKRIREYSLSTPYVISSASTTSNYLLHNKANVRGVDFNSDGTKIFLSGVSDRKVYQYNLASPYTLSSSQGTTADAEYHVVSVISGGMYSIAFSNDGTKLFILETNGNTVKQFSTTTTALGYGTGETWVNGTNNNEHATLQQALTSQAFNRMNKAQLDAIADANHFSQDSADTLDLMIAPYAASGSSPISDGVTINYDAEAIVREAIPGTDYVAEFPNSSTINIKSLVNANIKVRAL